MRSRARRALVALQLAATLSLAFGCAERETRRAAAPARTVAPRPLPSGPYVVVLGIAQDGGVPQAACSCRRCMAARRDARRRFHVASLAIVVPGAGASGHDAVFVVDATPDLPAQLAMLRRQRRPPPGRVDRSPLDGIVLTHAHIGHYLGLAHLGFEAVHARRIPLYCSARMARFLRDNGPWSQLVSKGNVVLHELAADKPIKLARGVTITGFSVPHRDEYSDTLAYRIVGPRRTVLFVPDTDAWRRWSPGLQQRLAGVDVALLDGTFYSADELPGREPTSIGHPLITATMARLSAAVQRGALAVRFIHLNHSNPALDPRSAAARRIRQRGFAVAREGEILPL